MMKQINKDTFCKIIRDIQEHETELSKLNSALSEVMFGYSSLSIGHKIINSLIRLLSDLFNDDDELIEWFLYEDVEKAIYNEDDTICCVLETPEDLYDYLTKYTKSTL